MIHQLQETALFQELERRVSVSKSTAAIEFRGQIESACNKLASYMGDMRKYFHHYTDHCMSHSIRILDRIGRILRKKQLARLSDVELFLMIASALVHDIGLVVAESEIQPLLSDEEFLRERDEILRHFKLPSEGDWTFHGMERMIVAEYIRRRHARRCTFKLKDGLLPCVLLTGGDATLTKWLSVICEGHTKPFDEIADKDNYPVDIEIGRQQANIRFISICLRIGDLLDIDSKRATPFLRELSEPLTTLSAAHWEQYQDVEVSGLGPGKVIKIGGTSPTQAAERLLKEWVSWLEIECARAMSLLHLSDEKYYLRLGRIEYAVEPQCGDDGKPLYEFRKYRFNLDEERVFKRLFGHRLYGRNDVAFRELIQNAVDATRVRVALEASQTNDWDSISDRERWDRFHDLYASRSKDLEISLSLSRPKDEMSGGKRLWLTIKDQGVGMTREVIERYLLKVGRSRWQEDSRLSRLPIGTVGEFGIGFLSTFMISDRTIIETQSCLPNESGIRVSIYGWKGYLGTEPVSLESPGTSISILLKEEVEESIQDLSEVVKYWCPFLELPVKVDSGDGNIANLLPRHTGKSPDHDRHLCLRLLESNSIVQIERSSYPRGDQIAPSLCQDGMIVPEVPPPILEQPQQQILRWRGIRVNLCGHDRLPLDLSRNLAEERADELWKQLTPKIWAAISVNGLSFSESRSALSELLHAETVRSGGRIVLILGPGKATSMGDVLEVQLPRELLFGEMSSKRIALAVKSNAYGTLVLPDVDRLFDQDALKFSQVRYEEVTDFIWRADDWIEDEHDDELEHEEKQLEKWFASLKDAEIDKTSPFRDQDAIDNWALAFQRSIVPSQAATRPLTSLFQVYPYAKQGDNGYSCLSSLGGKPLDETVAIWLNENWFAIRHPVHGNWNMVRPAELDGGLRAGEREKLRFVEYVLLLLYEFSTPLEDNSWGSGWRKENDIQKLGDTIFRAVDAGRKNEADDELDEDEHDEDPVTVEEKREFEMYERYVEFTDFVLPLHEIAILERLLLPWDIQKWENPQGL